MLEESRKTLDKAVALSPNDPNIYMMRVATLYIQGQYWPATLVPKANWEHIRDDCLKFIQTIGPEKMKKVSVHVRGEAYGELGVAYKKLGDKEKAKAAFKMVQQLDPGTEYAEKAKDEIKSLG